MSNNNNPGDEEQDQWRKVAARDESKQADDDDDYDDDDAGEEGATTTDHELVAQSSLEPPPLIRQEGVGSVASLPQQALPNATSTMASVGVEEEGCTREDDSQRIKPQEAEPLQENATLDAPAAGQADPLQRRDLPEAKTSQSSFPPAATAATRNVEKNDVPSKDFGRYVPGESILDELAHRPGAYRITRIPITATIGEEAKLDEEAKSDEEEKVEERSVPIDQNEEGSYIVEARLVPDPSSEALVPEGPPIREPEPSSSFQPFEIEASTLASSTLVVEAKPVKRKIWIFVVIALALIFIVVLVVVLVVALSQKETTASTPTMSPTMVTMAPSAQPTALPNMTAVLQDFRSRLPNETMIALNSTYSPQYKAYEWVTSAEQPPLFGIDPVTRMTQRFALVTLFYATGGNDWDDNEGWVNQSVNECDWFGCTCTTEGMLQSLDLRGNSLFTFSLPLEIGLLSTLESLDVGTNQLGGPIPTTVGLLTGLESLILEFNKLAGPIPTEIVLLTNLKVLWLASNTLKGTIPTILSILTNLESLDFAINELSGTIPAELGLLTKLSWLGAFGNTLNGAIPTQLGLLTNLENLLLAENDLRGRIPTEILLTTLKQLHLDNCSFTGTIPTEIALMSDIEKLLLADNLLTGSIPTSLGKLSKLGNLTLYKNLLNGSVPLELCEHIKKGMYIEIDCTLIECNCRCTCYENRTDTMLE